jgi:CelD/BcsL family acetyltransferase involved in cellulose biosynthesis
VQEVTTIEELRALRAEWSMLWDRCADATPFQAPEWLLPWWSHLFGGGAMWTLALRRQGRLAGLAPLFLHGYENGPRQLSSIGSGVTDYLGFLLENELYSEGPQAVWEHLHERQSRWDICDLQEIRPGSGELQSAFPSGWLVEWSASGVCPILKLPSTMEQLEANLAPKFRHNLRNARRRLLEIGESGFETATAGQDPEYVGALFRLHTAQWERRGETGMLSTSALQSFLREVVYEFRQRGWLRLHALRVRGEIVAVACVFLARRRAYFYLGGFDTSLDRLSPGTVMVGYAIEQAISQGAVEFDFLRKKEHYKYRWGAVDRVNARLVIQHAAGLKRLSGRG